MKFMLLCYDDEQYWDKASDSAHFRAALDEAIALTHELHARGQFIAASPLHPVDTATSVRVRNGKSMITDGPFAETREVLGGYYLIDVKDMNEAIEIAARHPGARVGTVEVRPVLEIPNLP